MIWYLLVCSGWSATTVCVPPQQMPSQSACQFVRAQYVSMRPETRIEAKCVGVRK